MSDKSICRPTQYATDPTLVWAWLDSGYFSPYGYGVDADYYEGMIEVARTCPPRAVRNEEREHLVTMSTTGMFRINPDHEFLFEEELAIADLVEDGALIPMELNIGAGRYALQQTPNPTIEQILTEALRDEDGHCDDSELG